MKKRKKIATKGDGTGGSTVVFLSLFLLPFHVFLPADPKAEDDAHYVIQIDPARPWIQRGGPQ